MLTQMGVLGKNKKAGTAAKKDGGSRDAAARIETWGDLEVRDGAWVAYRLGEKMVGKEGEEGAEDMDVDGDVDIDANGGAARAGDREWNVVVPSYEDEDDGQEGVDGMGEEGDGDEMDIPIPKPRNAIAR